MEANVVVPSMEIESCHGASQWLLRLAVGSVGMFFWVLWKDRAVGLLPNATPMTPHGARYCSHKPGGNKMLHRAYKISPSRQLRQEQMKLIPLNYYPNFHDLSAVHFKSQL